MMGGEIRRGVPIAICSVCITPRTRLAEASSGDKTLKDGKPTNPAFDEVSQILVQGILQFQDNPTLESYTGFTATIEKTTLRISMATISQSYLEQLRNWKEPSERFNF